MVVRRSFARRLLFGALLGLVWFGVLLIPDHSRRDLIGSDRSPWRMLLVMVAISALLTSVLPSAGLRSMQWMRHVLGILLPILGALFYTASILAIDLLTSLPDLFTRLDENPQGPISGFLGLVFGVGYFMFLIGVPVMTAGVLSKVWFVAFPMGILHIELATLLDRARAAT